ncbi:hypothetical protein [Nocardia mexicana]|uniref:Uncharacterized protein n=1 Tax=Nocardia mexicana TaxID=279262 RepID=A0A370GJY0_9NOCA|nr:hypothetical protein [Nocardia mexicana]RDI43536.1 hypothetical protein DFR68_1203 [Nocardia mexicana]
MFNIAFEPQRPVRGSAEYKPVDSSRLMNVANLSPVMRCMISATRYPECHGVIGGYTRLDPTRRSGEPLRNPLTGSEIRVIDVEESAWSGT